MKAQFLKFFLGFVRVADWTLERLLVGAILMLFVLDWTIKRLLVGAILMLFVCSVGYLAGYRKDTQNEQLQAKLGVKEAEASAARTEVDGLDETQIKRWAREACELHKVPFDLFWTILKTESNLDPLAISAVGALGIAQIMPSNASLCGLKKQELLNPRKGIFCGAQLLRRYKEATGDWFNATSYYNCGDNCTDKKACKPYYVVRDGKQQIGGYSCTLNIETHNYLRKTFGRMEG